MSQMFKVLAPSICNTETALIIWWSWSILEWKTETLIHTALYLALGGWNFFMHVCSCLMSWVRSLVLISSRVQQCFLHAVVGHKKIHSTVNKEEKKNDCRWISWKCYWLVVKILCLCAQNAKGKSPSMPRTLMDEQCCKSRFTAKSFLFDITFIMRSLSIVFFFWKVKGIFSSEGKPQDSK